jgi:hypothetical protein
VGKFQGHLFFHLHTRIRIGISYGLFHFDNDPTLLFALRHHLDMCSFSALIIDGVRSEIWNCQVQFLNYLGVGKTLKPSARARIMTLSDHFLDEAAQYLLAVFFFHGF